MVTKERYCNYRDDNRDAVTMAIFFLRVHRTDASREFSSAPNAGSVHILG